MAETSKKAIYKHFNGKEYERINLRTTAEQVDCDTNHRFITDGERNAWNGKASTAVATQSTAGLMTAADKKKLDAIEAKANNFVPPSSYAASMIVPDATHRFVTDTEKATWNGKASTSVATQGAAGLMTAADKKKLDGIEASIKTMVLNSFYPVGSIYMSVSSTNPNKTMGGTWLEWGQGRVPVGVNSNDSDFNKVELYGGDKTQELRAAIGAINNASDILSYCPASALPGVNYLARYGAVSSKTIDKINNVNHSTYVYRLSGGKTTYPTTVQPYITCYMWKRTK